MTSQSHESRGGIEQVPFYYDNDGQMIHKDCGGVILYLNGGWICECCEQWEDIG